MLTILGGQDRLSTRGGNCAVFAKAMLASAIPAKPLWKRSVMPAHATHPTGCSPLLHGGDCLACRWLGFFNFQGAITAADGVLTAGVGADPAADVVCVQTTTALPDF